MKRILRPVMALAILLLAFWLVTLLFPTPEKQVLRKLSALAEIATFDANTTSIHRAGLAGKFVDLFSKDAEIDLESAGYGIGNLSGHPQIRETAIAGFAAVQALEVRFLHPDVRIGPDKQSAEVDCTAEVHAGKDKNFALEEMTFEFRKSDGEWLVTRVRPTGRLR